MNVDWREEGIGEVNVMVVVALRDGFREGPGDDDDSESDLVVIGTNVIVCIASNACVGIGWWSRSAPVGGKFYENSIDEEKQYGTQKMEHRAENKIIITLRR